MQSYFLKHKPAKDKKVVKSQNSLEESKQPDLVGKFGL
jgi:hypothetical protein